MFNFKNRHVAAAVATISLLTVVSLPTVLFALIYMMGGYQAVLSLITIALIGGLYWMMYDDKTFYKGNSN